MTPAKLFILLTTASDPVKPAAGSAVIQFDRLAGLGGDGSLAGGAAVALSVSAALLGTGHLVGTSSTRFDQSAMLVSERMIGDARVAWRAVGYLSSGGEGYLALQAAGGFLVLEAREP